MTTDDRAALFTEALRDELRRLHEKRDFFLGQIEDAEHEIGLIQRMLERRAPGDTTPEQKPRTRTRSDLKVSVDEIRGMTPEEAAVRIAERNGGRFRSVPARKAMVQAGIVPPGNPGSTLLYQTMTDSRRFKRGQLRGEYILLPKEMEVTEAQHPTPFPIAASGVPTRYERQRIAI